MDHHDEPVHPWMVKKEGCCNRLNKLGIALCRKPAGFLTNHSGYGSCYRHGGRSTAEEWVWRMAFVMAQELDISPWDALLMEVRRSAARNQYLDSIVGELAGKDVENEELLSQEMMRALRESRAERKHLVTCSKVAIDAGIAERITQQIEIEGRLVAEAAVAALDALELTAEQRTLALTAAYQKILPIESGEKNESST